MSASALSGLCLALNSAKFLRSAAFQDLKCLFGQASFQEFKCFRLRFASPASRAPKKFTTQAYFRLSSAEPRNSKRQKVIWLVHFNVRFHGSATVRLATRSRNQPHKLSQGGSLLLKDRSLKTLHHEAASSEVNRNIKSLFPPKLVGGKAFTADFGSNMMRAAVHGILPRDWPFLSGAVWFLLKSNL